MTADTIHTCSYYCERPGCIRAQRDELRDRLEALTAAQQHPAAVDEAAFDANFLRHIASVCRAAYDLCQPKPQRTPEDVREYNGGLCLSELANIADEIEQRLAASNRKAVDGCHCGTCTCNPNMTLAVRFDLSPAQMEGAIRDHLIRLGWTPPRARQPAALSGGINVAGMKALDDLLDHIYEYGTAAEGVLERATAFARDVLARYAPIVPEVGYAGCTLWRGSLRTTVVETDSLERRLDPDQAFCDMVQRALDSLGALWDAGTSATQPQGDKQ